MPRMPDTAINEAYPGPPEPPRVPYQSDYQPVYPPIPAQCPRCQGCIVTQYEETRCLSCGWYLQPLPLPQEPTMMKSGAVLANIIEVRP